MHSAVFSYSQHFLPLCVTFPEPYKIVAQISKLWSFLLRLGSSQHWLFPRFLLIFFFTLQSSRLCGHAGSFRADATCCFNVLWSPHVKDLFQDSGEISSPPSKNPNHVKCCSWLFFTAWQNYLGEMQCQFLGNSQHTQDAHEQKTYDVWVTLTQGTWAIGSYSLQLRSHLPVLHCFLWVWTSWVLSTAPFPPFQHFPTRFHIFLCHNFLPENFLLTHCALLPVIHLFLPVKNQG